MNIITEVFVTLSPQCKKQLLSFDQMEAKWF